MLTFMFLNLSTTATVLAFYDDVVCLKSHLTFYWYNLQCVVLPFGHRQWEFYYAMHHV